MTYRFSSAFIVAAAAAFASTVAAPHSRAQEGPAIEERTLHTSDIQFRFTRSPDLKAMSVLFDNLSVALVPGGGAPTVMRVVPLTIPITRGDKGAQLRVHARGGLVCPDGTACQVLLWVNGHTKAMGASPKGTSPNFVMEAEFLLPSAAVHQAAVIVIAEREAKRPELAALISVDSLDLTVAPLPAEASATKK